MKTCGASCWISGCVGFHWGRVRRNKTGCNWAKELSDVPGLLKYSFSRSNFTLKTTKNWNITKFSLANSLSSTKTVPENDQEDPRSLRTKTSTVLQSLRYLLTIILKEINLLHSIVQILLLSISKDIMQEKHIISFLNKMGDEGRQSRLGSRKI